MDAFARHLPEGTASLIMDYVVSCRVIVRLSRPRRTKLGDYRPPHRGEDHRITVNADLNPYMFLLTIVHELAHAKTYLEYGHKVFPHGPEWKRNFSEMMMPLLDKGVFPDDLHVEVVRYIQNPDASSCADPGLTRSLRKYDMGSDALCFVSDLPYGAEFEWRRGKRFIRMEKLRKRYRCIEVATQRSYLFSPVAEVAYSPRAALKS